MIEEQIPDTAPEPEPIPGPTPPPVLSVDPDPGMMLIEQLLSRLIDMGIDLGKIETHTKEIQKEVTVVAQAVDHPALTTSFADYTVTEALLLFLLLAASTAACARMLRGGLLWLRS